MQFMAQQNNSRRDDDDDVEYNNSKSNKATDEKEFVRAVQMIFENDAEEQVNLSTSQEQPSKSKKIKIETKQDIYFYDEQLKEEEKGGEEQKKDDGLLFEEDSILKESSLEKNRRILNEYFSITRRHPRIVIAAEKYPPFIYKTKNENVSYPITYASVNTQPKPYWSKHYDPTPYLGKNTAIKDDDKLKINVDTSKNINITPVTFANLQLNPLKTGIYDISWLEENDLIKKSDVYKTRPDAFSPFIDVTENDLTKLLQRTIDKKSEPFEPHELTLQRTPAKRHLISVNYGSMIQKTLENEHLNNSRDPRAILYSLSDGTNQREISFKSMLQNYQKMVSSTAFMFLLFLRENFNDKTTTFNFLDDYIKEYKNFPGDSYPLSEEMFELKLSLGEDSSVSIRSYFLLANILYRLIDYGDALLSPWLILWDRLNQRALYEGSTSDTDEFTNIELTYQKERAMQELRYTEVFESNVEEFKNFIDKTIYEKFVEAVRVSLTDDYTKQAVTQFLKKNATQPKPRNLTVSSIIFNVLDYFSAENVTPEQLDIFVRNIAKDIGDNIINHVKTGITGYIEYLSAKYQETIQANAELKKAQTELSATKAQLKKLQANVQKNTERGHGIISSNMTPSVSQQFAVNSSSSSSTIEIPFLKRPTARLSNDALAHIRSTTNLLVQLGVSQYLHEKISNLAFAKKVAGSIGSKQEHSLYVFDLEQLVTRRILALDSVTGPGNIFETDEGLKKGKEFLRPIIKENCDAFDNFFDQDDINEPYIDPVTHELQQRKIFNEGDGLLSPVLCQAKINAWQEVYYMLKKSRETNPGSIGFHRFPNCWSNINNRPDMTFIFSQYKTHLQKNELSFLDCFANLVAAIISHRQSNQPGFYTSTKVSKMGMAQTVEAEKIKFRRLLSEFGFEIDVYDLS